MALNRVEVLDHGYCELVESWGSDERIIETARVSTQGGFKGWGPRCSQCGGGDLERREDLSDHPGVFTCHDCHKVVNDKPGDEKLLSYLATNHHDTPFEFAGATFEVQAPIFVFREWHRHRTQSYSEASARYSPLPDVNYVPTVERMMATGGANKQAGAVKGAPQLSKEDADIWLLALKQHYARAEDNYQWALQMGVPKEIARVCLPVGRYSRMRAQANLRNWIGFLKLRLAPNAQWEIREYAGAVRSLLLTRFPRTMTQFELAMPSW